MDCTLITSPDLRNYGACTKRFIKDENENIVIEKGTLGLVISSTINPDQLYASFNFRFFDKLIDKKFYAFKIKEDLKIEYFLGIYLPEINYNKNRFKRSNTKKSLILIDKNDKNQYTYYILKYLGKKDN